jgi:hypothetical protein
MEMRLRDGVGARRSLPCPTRFLDLAISPSAPLGWMEHIEGDVEPRMISPFLIVPRVSIVIRHLAELVAFVKAHPLREEGTPQRVADAYANFILHVDQLMTTHPKWMAAKKYDLQLAIAELRTIGR